MKEKGGLVAALLFLFLEWLVATARDHGPAPSLSTRGV